MSVRLERLLAMNAAIRGGGYPNVAVFMERFEVSERTVHADLTFMRERLNAPLGYECRHGDYARSLTFYKIALNRMQLLR
jgi:predicted DNA-binding transcriptional regulator YafY